MNLLIHRPNQITSEWVLSGKLSPFELSTKLQEFQFLKGSEGYYRSFNGEAISISWWRNTPSSNGFYLYYARFCGSTDSGFDIIHPLCRQLGLHERSFGIFVPMRLTDRKLEKAGFIRRTGSTSEMARCYERGEVALITFGDEFVLQIRAKRNREWEKLHGQIRDALMCFQTNNSTGIEKAV